MSTNSSKAKLHVTADSCTRQVSFVIKPIQTPEGDQGEKCNVEQSKAEQSTARQSKAAEAAADLGREFPDESCIHLQRQLPAEVKLRAEGLSLKGGLKRRNGQLQLVTGRE